MRTIERTTQFRRDYKREKRGRYQATIESDFVAIVTDLALGHPLPAHMRDHALTGTWKDHRDCHIRPDLVLIYRLVGRTTLQLVRLGSHSELGL